MYGVQYVPLTHKRPSIFRKNSTVAVAIEPDVDKGRRRVQEEAPPLPRENAFEVEQELVVEGEDVGPEYEEEYVSQVGICFSYCYSLVCSAFQCFADQLAIALQLLRKHGKIGCEFTAQSPRSAAELL